MREIFVSPVEEAEPRVPFVRENIRTDVQVGMIAEDCSFHIGEVLECDPQSGEVSIRSMFDGVVRHCDLYHCGVEVQTPADIEKKTALYKEGGIRALFNLYEESIKEIRS